MGAAVYPGGTNSTSRGVRCSMDETGWVGQGFCHAGVVGTGVSVTLKRGVPVRRSRMNVYPVFPAWAMAGTPWSVNSTVGGVAS